MSQPISPTRSPVTVRDVARLAEVSPRTVSNVVNDFPRVAPATKARVLKAIAELGYRPNAAARSLRSGRTGVIGLVVPEIDHPYFAELSRELIAEAERRGLTVVLDQTEDDVARELDFLERARRLSMFDGLIVNPMSINLDDYTKIAGDLPIVLLGERIFTGRFDHVHLDNVAAAAHAVQHLMSLGRTRMALLGVHDDPVFQTSILREQGFREALDAAGLPVDPHLLEEVGEYRQEAGYAAMSRILNRSETAPPDAVLCLNDALALGAIRAIHDYGLRIPEDLAVVGIDNIREGRFSWPSLTTIDPNKRNIAQQALDRLQGRIAGDTSPASDILVPHALVVRESTGAAPRPIDSQQR